MFNNYTDGAKAFIIALIVGPVITLAVIILLLFPPDRKTPRVANPVSDEPQEMVCTLPPISEEPQKMICIMPVQKKTK